MSTKEDEIAVAVMGIDDDMCTPLAVEGEGILLYDLRVFE
jgi:hypothetical protein